MASVADLHNTQKSLESSLLQKMTEFEAHLKAASHISTINQVNEEFKHFKEDTWAILKILRQQISEKSRNVNMAQTKHRRKFLIFNGIPEEPANKVENTSKTIASLLQDKISIPELQSVSLKAARQQLGVRNCWTLDGNIYAKLPNGTRCKLDSEADLAKVASQATNLGHFFINII